MIMLKTFNRERVKGELENVSVNVLWNFSASVSGNDLWNILGNTLGSIGNTLGNIFENAWSIYLFIFLLSTYS